MVNWPFWKRNEESRVAVKLKRLSVQWRTERMRSQLRLLIVSAFEVVRRGTRPIGGASEHVGEALAVQVDAEPLERAVADLAAHRLEAFLANERHQPAPQRE